MISAEIPNREDLPLLRDNVSSAMMDSPCGADSPGNVYMRRNECSKDFSIDFRDLTDVNVQGYPKYRHRKDGRTVEKHVPGRKGTILLDNRLVISYNPEIQLPHQRRSLYVDSSCQVPVQIHQLQTDLILTNTN